MASRAPGPVPSDTEPAPAPRPPQAWLPWEGCLSAGAPSTRCQTASVRGGLASAACPQPRPPSLLRLSHREGSGQHSADHPGVSGFPSVQLLCTSAAPFPFPLLSEPHPSWTEGEHKLTGSPSLPGVPSFPGGPGGPGGPCGPGIARASGLCAPGPGRPWEEERAQVGGATHTLTRPPTSTLSCILGWAPYHTGARRVDTHRVQPGDTDMNRGLSSCPPIPAHMLLVLRPVSQQGPPCARHRDTEEGGGPGTWSGHQ